MNLRLACSWVRQELVDRACHRLAVGPEQSAKEAALYEDAVAEVDAMLDPPEVDEADRVDVWSDPEWVAAMGGEMAGVN